MKQFLTLLMLHLIRINHFLFGVRKKSFTAFCLALLFGLTPAFAQFDLSNGANFNAAVGNPLSVTAQDGIPEAMTFSPDGMRMYFLGSTNDRVYQYNLSTAFDITTAVYNNFFAVGAQDGVPRGVAFSTDGTKMFMSGNVNVYQYNLSTAFQVNTATYSSTSYITAAAAGRGVVFSPTGDRMFFTATGDNSVRQYNLSTAYDISTASYIGLFSFTTQDSSPQSTYFSPDGFRMFMVGDNADRVFQYNLTTAFELSTATYSGSSVLISAQESSPTDAVLSADGTRMYVIGDVGKEINQYNLVIYYSRQTGNWNDTNTWSSTCGGAAGIGVPPVGANVMICNGHTVTLTANATCNNLTINTGGTLKPASFNLTVSANTQISGTFDDDTAGGTSTFTGTFTVNNGGDFTAAAGGMNYFVFRGNITNNGTGNIDIGANTDYTFNPVGTTLTITANGTGTTWFGANGGGTKAGRLSASKNLIIAAGAGSVELYGDDANGFEILTGATVTNQKPVVGNHLSTNLLRGAGSFINTNAALIYRGAARPMVTGGGTFTFGTSDFVGYYRGGAQDVTAGTYNNVEFYGGVGDTKTLTGAITVNGSFLINYATLDVSTSNFNIIVNGNAFRVLNGGSFIPRNGTVTLGGGDHYVFDGSALAPINFYNLVINRTLSTDRIIIHSPATVSNTLTLTNGKLYLQTGNLTLTNPTPANQILPASPTSASYIATTNNGMALVRQNLGVGTYTFPVGNDTQFQPFLITNPSATVSVRFGLPTATVPTSGVGSWFVSNGSTTSTVRFNNPQGGTLLTNISAVGKYNGSAWVAMTGTTYPTATDYSVSNVFAGGIVEFGILTTNAFRTTWVTTNNQIIFPSGNTNTYNITWRNLTSPGVGNGSATGVSGNYTITGLTNAHTYQIDVTGNFSWFYMNNNATERTKIKTIESWGNITWTSMQGAFWGCNTLQLNATDAPILSGTPSFNNMFQACTAFTGNASMSTWNTSLVTNMSGMFYNSPAFNQNIGAWNTSAVTNMSFMFENADAFNQNISAWNTSNVTAMNSMFYQNTAFNQDLSAWNVSNVSNMNFMFDGATAFNQNLGNWTLRSAGVTMGNMLNGCGMNTNNYDATLVGWASQSLTGVTLGATGRTYCTAFGARNTLTVTKGWTISGDSNACLSFNAVTATNVTSTSFRANWTIGTAPYTLDVSTDINFGVGFFVVGYNNLNVGNVSSYNVTGLTANTVYYYRVKHTSGTVISNTKMASTALPAGSGNLVGFDGTIGKKVEVTNNTICNFTDANTFTLSAWIKINATGTDMHIISKRNATQGYALWVNTVGRLAVFRNATSDVGTTILPTNTWVHVAVVFSSGGGFTTYINGLVEATVGGTTITATTENLTIGSRADNSFRFNGQIDEVHIWNTTRTQAQIQASMCSKLVGNETGLVGYFRFDENTGTATENKALNATFDAALVGSPAWATSGAPLGDISANTYGGSTVTLTNTDAMTANGFLGTPAGVHLYKVNATPNATSAPTGYNSMRTDRYWGLFLVGGTSPTANLAYDYATNGNISNENAFRFGKRDNNTDGSWEKNGGVVYDTDNLLLQVKETSGEFILCEKNTNIPQVRNGGMVLNLNGANGVMIPNPVSTNFTIEFWMRSSQASTGATNWYNGVRLISSTLASNGTQNDYGVSVLGGKLAFGIGNTTIVSTTSVNTGAWFHVAVKRQISGGNSILTIVLNGGREVVTSSVSTNISALTASTNLTIGNRNNTDFYFTGEFDELRFWDTVLTNINISNWMNLRANQNHSNIQNLVAYYRFDENIGNTTENLITSIDAAMTTSAMWVNSTQPLADGAFHRLTINTPSQTANFVNAGVTIHFGTTVPNGEVVATQLDAVPNNFPAVAGMSFLNSYWVIRNYGTNQTFSYLPEIKFEVPTGNVISPTDLANPNNIKLYKRPDNAVLVGDWIGVARATGFGSIRFAEAFAGGSPTDVPEFSQFVIGSASSPLPITLLGLKGRRVEGLRGEMTEEVSLEWQTSSEINNKGFEVEMSVDGLTYQKVAFVEGRGNSTTIQQYNHTTIQPNEAYYRLRQVDIDGTFSYSPVVFVEGMVREDLIWVYPNPTQNEFKLKTSDNILPTEAISIDIYDMAGKCVWRGAGKLEKVEADINITFHTWKAGTYLLYLRTDKKKLQTKFVKE
jgi:surface protein